ncbi:DUF2254 domain-containing protein [Planctomycetes bacterium K23_9]|uniref:DUF2254 domain-containing protein n=1 Tax=Stieleria marina TaxID=1930275 RepID=A0A517NVI9_9BACT|nr:hypothetical protein K239x_31370 [Planctomycetes bacterium K23_9]
MNALLITLWERTRKSYWFVPSLMALAAIALSFLTTAIDSRIGSEWMEGIGMLYANKPAGARAVLSTVAGSMITVAGVTFSMTILSISHTTSQVGPRLLNNFMGDKANQFTLGVFIATFLYCLMVLRTVRNAETTPADNSQSAELVAAFVPQIAVIIGVMMAIASVGVLIFFIHHIPESIHVSNIVAGVGRGLNERIEKQFPARVGSPNDDESQRNVEADLRDSFRENAKPIPSVSVGYVDYVDGDGLMQIAVEHDLVIRVLPSPGDFITEQSLLALVSPESGIDDRVEKEVTSMFILGTQRTATQDLRFQIDQLVEVAMRALSPGVNDPFTAFNCMDWVQACLENLASRELPDAHRYDEDQKLRVVAEPVTFAAFASLVFDQLRPYVAVDRNASVKLIEMIGNLVMNVEDKQDRRILAKHACALLRECRQALDDTRTLNALRQRYRDVLRLASDVDARADAKASGVWVGAAER